MILFRKKLIPNLGSEEYEKLVKRIIELNGFYEQLKTKIEILNTNYDNLRGNFNRKLSGIKLEEEKKTENINSDGTVYLG